MRHRTILARTLAGALFAAALAAAIGACKKRVGATQAECEGLIQKYFDLKAQDDPRLKTLPPAQRDELVRQMKAELMATDPDMRQVAACTSELTHAEYECAIKATTTHQWNDCID